MLRAVVLVHHAGDRLERALPATRHGGFQRSQESRARRGAGGAQSMRTCSVGPQHLHCYMAGYVTTGAVSAAAPSQVLHWTIRF